MHLHELYPGNFKPTMVHYFIKLLQQKGLLLRNFTQNVDTLERLAGIPVEYLVEAHGSFATAHCIDCHKEANNAEIKECVFAERIPRCQFCGGLVKPDIVFFGESLPSSFFEKAITDFPKCDLLLVIGTSLKVQPFASLVDQVPPDIPRVLINREIVGTSSFPFSILGLNERGFRFDAEDNLRDIAMVGDCQEIISELIEKLGWKEELLALLDKSTGKI